MRFDLLPFSPRLIQARWEFGNLPSEEAPLVAQNALELGYDGKYTRRIAGLIQPTHFELEPLMPAFLAELGFAARLSKADAGLLLARLVAAAVADGQIPPYTGARFIWREIVNEMWATAPKRLLSFVGNASEYEDCEVYSKDRREVERMRREIEEAIVEDARDLARESQ